MHTDKNESLELLEEFLSEQCRVLDTMMKVLLLQVFLASSLAASLSLEEGLQWQRFKV